jgi:hypothetical protein
MNQWLCLADESRTTLNGPELESHSQMLKKVFRKGLSHLNPPHKGLATFLPHHRVRIMPLRQQQEAQLTTFTEMDQTRIQRFPGRIPTGGIPVETEHNGGGIAK